MNKEFCLKTMPWFIKINNELEWNIVNDWLMKISGNRVHCNYVERAVAMTNCGCSGLENRFMWTDVIYGGEEIKLNFKTVISEVKFPEVKQKSEKELQIEKLESTIKQAQEELQQLKNIK